MKKLFWILIILAVVLFIPLVPYEDQVQEGVTRVEYRSLFQFVKERYEKVQKRVGVVSPEVPKVHKEDVVPKSKHVQ